MGNYIFRLKITLSMFTTTISDIENKWLIGVLMGGEGGLLYEYVNVINTYPHWYVKNGGIDNNKIASVTVSTVGALAHSQAVPVIILMY